MVVAKVGGGSGVEREGSGVATESHPFPCLVSPGPEAVRGGWAAGAGAGGPCSASSLWGWVGLARPVPPHDLCKCWVGFGPHTRCLA
jgi:hypothetical protein